MGIARRERLRTRAIASTQARELDRCRSSSRTYPFDYMRPLLTFLFFALAATAFVGCDSGDPNDDDNANCDSGSMTATAAGQAFDAECVVFTYENGVFSASGITNLDGSDGATQRQIILTVPMASVGNHPIGGFTNFNMAIYADATAADINNPSVAYTANNLVGSGQITLDAVSANGARGSFSFTAQNSDGETVQVSNGQFDISD